MGGKHILNINNNSIYQLLTSIIPEYEWVPWRFSRLPKNYWEDVKNQRKFMDWAGKELGIKEMDDWYKVPNEVCFCFLECYSD